MRNEVSGPPPLAGQAAVSGGKDSDEVIVSMTGQNVMG